jgi:hypothetical protein
MIFNLLFGFLSLHSMKAYKFIKEGRAWYIDLPEFLEHGGSKGDLQMVEGADVMLDLISGDEKEVSLILDRAPFPIRMNLPWSNSVIPRSAAGIIICKLLKGKSIIRRCGCVR